MVSSDNRHTPSSHLGCWPVAVATSHVWVVISLTYIANISAPVMVAHGSTTVLVNSASSDHTSSTPSAATSQSAS